MSKKIAIVAPAIKTYFWKELYNNFSRNDCSFEFFFVGHVKPDFDLPKNFHYFFADERPTKCALIAYKKAHESDCEYIQNVADDCLYEDNHFDKLISAYENEEKNGNFLICGPQSYNGSLKNVMALFPDKEHWDKQSRMAACIRAGGTEEHLGCSLEGPALPTGNFSSLETSKKLDKIDLNYKALYWDCDLVLKLHSLNGRVVILDSDKVPPVKERFNSNSRLWQMFGKIDYNYLVNKWDVRAQDGKTWKVTRKV